MSPTHHFFTRIPTTILIGIANTKALKAESCLGEIFLVENIVKGTRNKNQGTRNKVQGIRHKVQGTRHKVQGTRNKVQGTRNKEQGTRNTWRKR